MRVGAVLVALVLPAQALIVAPLAAHRRAVSVKCELQPSEVDTLLLAGVAITALGGLAATPLGFPLMSKPRLATVPAIDIDEEACYMVGPPEQECEPGLECVPGKQWFICHEPTHHEACELDDEFTDFYGHEVWRCAH